MTSDDNTDFQPAPGFVAPEPASAPEPFTPEPTKPTKKTKTGDKYKPFVW